jgi:hypothetical protein
MAVVAPGVGLAAGAGAIVGHFHHNIPKEKVEEAGTLLESGEAGLIVVAVNKLGTNITPLLKNAEAASVAQTTADSLDAEIDKNWPRPERARAEQHHVPRDRPSRSSERGAGVSVSACPGGAGVCRLRLVPDGATRGAWVVVRTQPELVLPLAATVASVWWPRS